VLVTGFSFVRESARAIGRARSGRVLVLAPAVGLLLIVLDSQLSGRLFEEPYLWLLLGLAYSAQAGVEESG